MSLTPEEKRAVEAARLGREYALSDDSHGNDLTDLICNESDRLEDEEVDNDVIFHFAMGHLAGDRDGFRRGVEAALAQVGCPDREASVFDLDIDCARFDIRDRIRALLAQEEQRG